MILAIILLSIYWAIGIFVLINDWREHSDVNVGLFLFIVVLLWVAWPVILAPNFKKIIISKKHNGKRDNS